jgi:hypothetical protein
VRSGHDADRPDVIELTPPEQELGAHALRDGGSGINCALSFRFQ